MQRWNVEVTFQEVRAHLGVETRAAVVRQGDCPHHALPTRPVLDRHAAGCTAPGPPTATHRGRRVVPQTAPDLRRCARRRALCDLAREDFGDITAPTRPNKTPLPIACALALCALPRCMNGQSRAKDGQTLVGASHRVAPERASEARRSEFGTTYPRTANR